MHYVKPFSEIKPLNNNIESNKTNFTISPLKFNNSLKENIHIRNEASQNINNIKNKKINEKKLIAIFFKKTSSDITIKKIYTNIEKKIKR